MAIHTLACTCTCTITPGAGLPLPCRECGYEVVEMNASDTRNKSGKASEGVAGKLSNVIREMANNTTLADAAGRRRQQLLVMDEVDGMSGALRCAVLPCPVLCCAVWPSAAACTTVVGSMAGQRHTIIRVQCNWPERCSA